MCREAPTLIAGVAVGITITASMPRLVAESATPCAWLPAEQATIPFASALSGSDAILLYAPRSLKENTGWVSSRLSSTSFSMRVDRIGASCSSVSLHTS